MRGTFSAADYTPGLLCATKIFFQKKLLSILFQITVFFQKRTKFLILFSKAYFFQIKAFSKNKKNKTFFKQRSFTLIKMLIFSKLFI